MLGILEILDKDQVMYFVRSNNLSFKCQRFTPSGFKYIEIRKVEVLTRTRFLCPLSAPLYRLPIVQVPKNASSNNQH